MKTQAGVTGPVPQVALARLRSGIEHELLRSNCQHHREVRLALNEAEAIAWLSGVPHLVFPALAEEKVESVRAWHRRQQEILGRDGSIGLAE